MTSPYRSHQSLVGSESTIIQRCRKIWQKASQLVSQRCLKMEMHLNGNSLFRGKSLSDHPPFPRGSLGTSHAPRDTVTLAGSAHGCRAVGRAEAGMADLAWSLALVMCTGGLVCSPFPVWVWVTQHPLLKPLVSPLPLVVRVRSLRQSGSTLRVSVGP